MPTSIKGKNALRIIDVTPGNFEKIANAHCTDNLEESSGFFADDERQVWGSLDCHDCAFRNFDCHIVGHCAGAFQSGDRLIGYNNYWMVEKHSFRGILPRDFPFMMK